MQYDIILLKIENNRSKQILARQIASDPSISLQKAFILLNSLPYTYMKNAEEKQVKQIVTQLHELGVVHKIVESASVSDKLGVFLAPVDESAAIVPESGIDIDKSDNTGERDEKEVDSTGTATESGTIHDNNGKKYTQAKQPSMLKTEQRKRSEYRVSHLKTSSGKSTGSKKNRLRTVLLTLCIITVFAAMMYYAQINRKYVINSTMRLKKKPHGQKYASSTLEKHTAGTLTERSGKDGLPREYRQNEYRKESRKKVSFSQKQMSQTLVDTAHAYRDDYQKAIRFYRIALSYNEYNLQAWYGLIGALKYAQKWDEAAKAQQRMIELFGEDIFSIKEIVEPYGSLCDYSVDNTGSCRIEYSSLAVKRSVLENETFFLVRALSARNSYTVISIYASTGNGSGMLVRIKGQPVPHTISEYRNRASITYIK